MDGFKTGSVGGGERIQCAVLSKKDYYNDKRKKPETSQQMIMLRNSSAFIHYVI